MEFGSPLFWLVVALLFAVGELLTISFFLIPFSGGALAAALAKWAGAGETLTWLLFVIVSAVLIVALRPIARSHRKTPANARTGVDALIGEVVVVIERVSNDEGTGCIRFNGEVWTARSESSDSVYELGSKVSICSVKGATVLVKSVEV